MKLFLKTAPQMTLRDDEHSNVMNNRLPVLCATVLVPNGLFVYWIETPRERNRTHSTRTKITRGPLSDERYCSNSGYNQKKKMEVSMSPSALAPEDSSTQKEGGLRAEKHVLTMLEIGAWVDNQVNIFIVPIAHVQHARFVL
jgi:hypothetical protein